MILQNYRGFKIMAVIEIKALEKLALTHMRQRAWDYFTFQRRMLRKVTNPSIINGK